MKITRRDVYGKDNTREIDITPEQMAAWEAGGLIQNVAPNLSPYDREFLISGTTPEQWDALMAATEADEAALADDPDRDDEPAF